MSPLFYGDANSQFVIFEGLKLFDELPDGFTLSSPFGIRLRCCPISAAPRPEAVTRYPVAHWPLNHEGR